MRSKKFIAANWKMNKTVAMSEKFISDIICKKQEFECDVLICPSFLSITSIIGKCHAAGLFVGAQNCYCENSGAFTGEISAPMLSDIAVDYVILGHSERRAIFGETDEVVAKKVNNAIKNHLKVVLCVGETQCQRDCGKAAQTVLNQIEIATRYIQSGDLKNIVVAYEPIWAVGTGKVINPLDADKMCEGIRSFVDSKYGNNYAQNLCILYGGSINSKNAQKFLSIPNIDGALIGGASLEAEEFLKIIDIAENIEI